MSASIKCHHPGLSYSIETELADEDGGLSYAKITAARCPHCGARWRYLGVDPGFDPDGPSANRNATALLLPMVEIWR